MYFSPFFITFCTFLKCFCETLAVRAAFYKADLHEIHYDVTMHAGIYKVTPVIIVFPVLQVCVHIYIYLLFAYYIITIHVFEDLF